MSRWIRLRKALRAARSPLGGLFIASALAGVLGFALAGETPVGGTPLSASANEWLLPSLPAANAPDVDGVWSAGVWATQSGPAPTADVEAAKRIRITLLGVVQRGGRLEAILLTEDGQRLRQTPGDALPGGATLVRISSTEVAWIDVIGKETVVRVLSHPDASSADAGQARSQ